MATETSPVHDPEEAEKARAALQRAMPITRMLDYGMDYADAVALHRRAEAGEVWDMVAEELAGAWLAMAEAAQAAGHRATAAEAYAFAGADLIFGQMAFNFDVPRKRALYAALVGAYAQAAELTSGVSIKRIGVAYGGSRIVAWQVVPSSSQPPTVILFGGQSGWGCAYLPLAQALAARGVATLLTEIPGQGETRVHNRLFLDERVHEALSAVARHAVASERLGDRVGVWGNSFGGVAAALAAARDPLFSACCVNGAHARPQVLPYRTAQEQGAAMVGVAAGDERVEQVFRALRFDPARERIECPLLVMQGGADRLVERADQQPFLDASPRATLREWEDGEHTIYNHSRERAAFAADWFADALGATEVGEGGARAAHTGAPRRSPA